MSALSTTAQLLRATAGSVWRDHPGRLVLAALGIALGVALGAAVHLINASAANEFDLAMRALSGEADLVVRGPRSGFREDLYPLVARDPRVYAASPALEVDAQVSGRRETIRIIGLDPFRAAQVQPQLLGDSREALLELLKPDTVMLSRTAADALDLALGDMLQLHAGSGVMSLRIVGLLPAGAARQRLAIMDISGAQWRLGRLGELHRMDLKLVPGAQAQAFARDLERILPAGVLITTPGTDAQRSVNLTRAYRVNLDMLALVALFTGAFLVFSTQFLALTRRRAQLAVLRIIGTTRRQLLAVLLIEATAIGAAGSALGIAMGIGLAKLGIDRFGGDLGAGYFSAVTPLLLIEMHVLAIFFVLGVGFALVGAALPALEAVRRAPAAALKSGDAIPELHRRGAWVGIALMACGVAVSQAPAIHELPIGGYAAVALILGGAMLVMPHVAEMLLARLPQLRYPPAALAAAQLRATPREVGVSLAAIVASVSLVVSMLIMIGSFRTSLENWLEQMLPADLYVRAGRMGDTGYFSAEEQARMKAAAGVRDAVFGRSQNLFVRADRPPVTLLARPLQPGRAHPDLLFEGPRMQPAAHEPPAAWLSEVAADLLGVRTGGRIVLPIAGAFHTFTVAGVWRDYARQNGAIVIDHAHYLGLTGDGRANEAAVYMRRDVTEADVTQALRGAIADAQGLEITSTRELKSISLALFDRTFAVTYGLQIAAVVIGLFGVSASFSSQALARRREFGVLRHIGMTRRQIGALLACEGFGVGTLGALAGLALGWALSLILIHVINRQAFHWSMDLHTPWAPLAGLAATLVLLSSLTAVLSARRAMSSEVTRAVREDW